MPGLRSQHHVTAAHDEALHVQSIPTSSGLLESSEAQNDQQILPSLMDARKLRDLEEEIQKLKASENAHQGISSPKSSQSENHSTTQVSPAEASPSSPLWQPIQLGDIYLSETAVSEIVEQCVFLDCRPPQSH